MNTLITVTDVTFSKYIFKESCLMEKSINEGGLFSPSLQIKYIVFAVNCFAKSVTLIWAKNLMIGNIYRNILKATKYPLIIYALWKIG